MLRIDLGRLRIDLGRLFHSLIVLEKNDCKWDVVDIYVVVYSGT